MIYFFSIFSFIYANLYKFKEIRPIILKMQIHSISKEKVLNKIMFIDNVLLIRYKT